MYIFEKPPVTIPLSNVKVGPKITPINYAYLAVWERKYSHSPKTWECVTKTKQPNKLGLAHSSRGLVPAEGQSVLIVTQVVQHGNLSSGNVPHDDDGFFLSVSVLQATGQSGPSFFFNEKQGYCKTSIPRKEAFSSKYWEIAFRGVPSEHHSGGIPLPKKLQKQMREDVCCSKASHDRNTSTRTLLYVKTSSAGQHFRGKKRLQCSSLCASSAIYQAGCLF